MYSITKVVAHHECTRTAAVLSSIDSTYLWNCTGAIYTSSKTSSLSWCIYDTDGLGWDVVIVKAVAYHLHHFHPHQAFTDPSYPVDGAESSCKEIITGWRWLVSQNKCGLTSDTYNSPAWGWVIGYATFDHQREEEDCSQIILRRNETLLCLAS